MTLICRGCCDVSVVLVGKQIIDDDVEGFVQQIRQALRDDDRDNSANRQ